MYFNAEHYSTYELGGGITSFPFIFIKTTGYVKEILFQNTIRKKFKNNILNPQESLIIYLLDLLTILIIIFGGIVIIILELLVFLFT